MPDAPGNPVKPKADPPQPWRVGDHYGIHVYEGDRPVATFHRAEEAALAVAAHNQADTFSRLREWAAEAELMLTFAQRAELAEYRNEPPPPDTKEQQ